MPEHELQRLKVQHKRIIDFALAGFTNVEVARAVDMTPQAVGMILRSPVVQDELARRRAQLDSKVDGALAGTVDQAKRLLEEKALEAAQVHTEIIADPTLDPRVRQASSDAILDRVLGKKGAESGAQQVVVLDVEKLNIAFMQAGVDLALEGEQGSSGANAPSGARCNLSSHPPILSNEIGTPSEASHNNQAQVDLVPQKEVV